MSTGGAVLLLIIGMTIVLGLAGWAAYLFYRLRQQQTTGPEPSYSVELTSSSIAILARGALDEQVDITEACIRIATLLDHLTIDDTQRREYAAIYRLSEATVHIPRLQQWQDLSKDERVRLRKEKEQLERTHIDKLRPALQLLVQRHGSTSGETTS